MTDTMPEKIDLSSVRPSNEKLAALRDLIPEAFTEGKIDFEALRRALGDAVDTAPREERFGLRWPGKSKLQQVINQPSVGTLVPQPEESVDWDTTQNMIIEGDNLEVLKLLQKSYAGKVKMIYIDPPYNTGNDFVYPDNHIEGLQSYLEFTGQRDAEGRKLQSNTESEGRYHANWLNMMYPRLYLARNLLREDGVIFVSIDDHELPHLRSIMSEIFGEDNLGATIVWQKKYAVSNDDPGIAYMHDYVVCYAKSDAFQRNLLPRTEKQNSRYSNPDDDPNGPWTSGEYVSGKSRFERPTLWYSITHPITGEEVWPDENAVWRYTKEKHLEMEAQGRLYWGVDGGYSRPRLKRYLSEVQQGIVPSTWWSYEEAGHNDSGQKETARLIGRKVFDAPKPTSLISRMITIGASGGNDIILDFFAGSGSTAHAVMQQNAEDGGNRRYILVQLPEPLEEPKTLDDGTTVRTIADICRERVRRAGKKIAAENGGKDIDTGFRAYRLASSNFRPWDGRVGQDGADGIMTSARQASFMPQTIQQQLELAADHLRPDANDESLLAELLLRLGFELTTPVAKETLAGKTVYNVDEGLVLICLDRQITLNVIAAMAKRMPAEIICLDAGFPDDGTKVNAGQIIASHARDEETSIAFKVV